MHASRTVLTSEETWTREQMTLALKTLCWGFRVCVIDAALKFDSGELGRPLGYFLFSLMALIGDHIYQYFSRDFRGQPSSRQRNQQQELKKSPREPPEEGPF